MNNAINLYPWRLAQHRQRTRRAILILLGLALLYVSLMFGLEQQTQSYKRQQLQLAQQQQQNTQQLNQSEQQSHLLQQRLQQQQQSAVEIPTDLLNSLLNQLSTLPFNQGELDFLQLSAEQLQLSGYATSQGEFEQIHQYLSQLPQIKQLQLSQFNPQPEGILQFEFQLQF